MSMHTSQPKSPGGRAISLTGQTIDLTASGLQGSDWDVQVLATTSFFVTATTWANAHIELKWSVDRTNFFSFAKPVTRSGSDGIVGPLDLRGARYVKWEVTVTDGSASDDCIPTFYGESRDSR